MSSTHKNECAISRAEAVPKTVSKAGKWSAQVPTTNRASSMAHLPLPLPLSILLSFLLSISIPASSSQQTLTLGLDIHHRFSAPVRRWAESSGKQLPGGWPETGSPEYYSALAGHDLAGAVLSGSTDGGTSPWLTFSEGNATLKVNSLGFLYYSLVTIGTPSMTFLVALDTGSDLFWLPCDCSSCAPSSLYTESEMLYYDPNMSKTSQRLPCKSDFCEVPNGCSESKCPYKIVYVSADTSSSGFLVEDVLYLTTEDEQSEIVQAPIIFGCGEVQTGSFLDTAAPNGLLGLGLEKISVPSLLSEKGLIANSFSMCFGKDGFGRISFGDRGTADQMETDLHVYPNHLMLIRTAPIPETDPPNPRRIRADQFRGADQLETDLHVYANHPTYNITINGASVGNVYEDFEFNTLFDTGTSFTYLADPAYTFLTENFNEQIEAARRGPDSRIPFEYCYNMSSNDTSMIQTPNISLKTESGSLFPVNLPGLVVSLPENEFVYCLALVKSNGLNIIGQNFMTGLRVVFDRERKILGWKKFNCYDVEDSNPLPVNPRNNSKSPSVRNNYGPQDTKENKNDTTKATSLTPLSISSFINPKPFFMLCLTAFTVLLL